MKRLLDEPDAQFGALTELLSAVEPHRVNPFAKRLVQSRIARALPPGARRRFLARPLLLGAGALLIAASAAAASYVWLAPGAPAVAPAAPAAPPPPSVAPPPLRRAAPTAPVATLEPPSAGKPSESRVRARPGEDPSLVAEAVRALRKQGDPARAQALLEQYLRSNPHGALSEDALALSIEAAAARKDPRVGDYARRYLTRYPNGRFRSIAERVLSR